jgi:hypothetical protein
LKKERLKQKPSLEEKEKKHEEERTPRNASAPTPWSRGGFGRPKGYVACDSCLGPFLIPDFTLKFHYTKIRFLITLKCWRMFGVLNIDEIKN